MSEWKTLNSEIVDVGGNNFIEITLKEPPEGDNIYLGISKGWTGEDGSKRYKANILFDKTKKDDIIKAIEKVYNS